ncbi:hypothetical protein AZA_31740 [Nitrospirillum viridazoti Y2]|uniref:TniB protein n=1 Tax=Nitrospirillum amazonense TaxID=28077 RepID=A0A560IDH7_9PROT|nr:TniB family NTP-binding protein [Nitrospirillum amazonense]EGY02503.1 hypothetical protein AZA_31740 [Nitrospirillum amazonense Y2]TWB56151.1 TniB protein [Nitrospirillum amazonense]
MDYEQRIERCQNIFSIFIDLPHVTHIQRRIRRFMDVGCPPDATAADSLCLVGPSRSGKSALINRLIADYPPEQRDRQSYNPIAYVEVKSNSTLKGLAITVAESLGCLPTVRALSEHIGFAVRMLEQAKPRLLVIDELQHVVRNSDGKRRTNYEGGDLIKSLLNARVCPILLVGLESSMALLDANEQLLGRNGPILEIKPFNWMVPAERQLYEGFVFGFEERLGFPRPSNLWSDDLLIRLWAASGGLIGKTTKLIRFASEAALLDYDHALPCITKDILADVYDQLSIRRDVKPGARNNPRPNPFRVESIDLSIYQEEEDDLQFEATSTQLRRVERDLRP